jgi:DNA-binding response OmpR family regulator
MMKRVGCKVLIVDDDADTREVLAEALMDAGFAVERAASGKQAPGQARIRARAPAPARVVRRCR